MRALIRDEEALGEQEGGREGLADLPWANLAAVGTRWRGQPGVAGEAGPRCRFTHQQGCPCEDSVQSITSNTRLFSHPAMETASLYKPC